jgi:hypothetical protein
VPAQFTGAWEQYAENYCFVQNTYWLRMHDTIPQEVPEREERQLGYYQWVPFILAIQAMLFYVPVLFWRQFNWQSGRPMCTVPTCEHAYAGIDVESIVKMAADTANIASDSREKAVNTVSRHIWDAIELQRHFLGADHGSYFTIISTCGKTRGVYVSCVYLFCKFMYIGNLVRFYMPFLTFVDRHCFT